MALIKCPECGNHISEFAEKCVFCGCPREKIRELVACKNSSKPTPKTKNPSTSKLIKCLNDEQKSFVRELCNIIENTPL